MKSISNLIKEEISSISDKQKLCCSFATLYGMMLSGIVNEGEILFSTNVENIESFKKICENISQKKKIDYTVEKRKVSVATNTVRYFTIAEIEKIFKCNNCTSNFLKGVFIFHGSVADPNKTYRLDLSFNDKNTAEDIQKLLEKFDLNFKITVRNNKYVVYTKNYETIASFLGLIGANNYAYEVINSKIEREIRNEANRMTNCDSANINKALATSQKHCDIINKIINEGYFKDLPANLREVAIKRIELPSLNLLELGNRFDPPLSKSCIHHRLEKIVKFYEKINL